MDFIVDYTPAATEHHVITGEPIGGSGLLSSEGYGKRTGIGLHFQNCLG